MPSQEEVAPEMVLETDLLKKGGPPLGIGSYHVVRNRHLLNDQKRKARKRINHSLEVHHRLVGLSQGQIRNLREENRDQSRQSQARDEANLEIVK